MNNLATILLFLCCVVNLGAQNSPNNFRIGIITSIDNVSSSGAIYLDRYTGYSVDFKDIINCRLGLNLEYGLKNSFALNTAIQYSNKDFERTYFCDVCDFSVPPNPEEIDFRLVEVPVSVRYYFLPGALGFFGEAGINNQFLLNEEVTDRKYFLGLELGAGLEYSFTQNFAFQFLLDYHRGVTGIDDDFDLKIHYFGFGVGLMKKL